MNRPTISFLIPTHSDERPLPRALWSIVPQLLDGDEVIVVGDTFDGPLPNVEKTCEIFRDRGYNVRYLSLDGGRHSYGHDQLNYGFTQAKSDLININDDDDIWSRDAAENIRYHAELNPGRPLLFRFVSVFGTIYWEVEGLVARNHIGGHCLVQPNLPGKLGTMTPEYSGDFDLIDSCLNAYGGYDSAVWVNEIIALARPIHAGVPA